MPTVEDTYIENRHRVQPNHANVYESAHGGNVMKWMDETGALSATRFAGEACVTAALDGMEFEQPIPIGQTAVVEAYVYDAGRTSAHVRVLVDKENPRTGERKRTTAAHFVFVAVENGEPVPVPDLTVDSERGERLRQKALEDR